ncbi:ATP-binding protein [uncultured Anaerolinea sp.]|uniref:ATP-binding protein n=1 Tax=Anaerolinea sp. TaxID=1872519 RepID=UPI003426DC52
MILRIEDDGVGMDVENLPVAGLGLKTMRERAEAIGGKLSLQSALGQGTVVTFEVSL